MSRRNQLERLAVSLEVVLQLPALRASRPPSRTPRARVSVSTTMSRAAVSATSARAAGRSAPRRRGRNWRRSRGWRRRGRRRRRRDAAPRRAPGRGGFGGEVRLIDRQHDEPEKNREKNALFHELSHAPRGRRSRRHGIDARRARTDDSARRGAAASHSAAHQAVLVDRLDGVRRARRLEPAGAAGERREQQLVGANEHRRRLRARCSVMTVTVTREVCGARA